MTAVLASIAATTGTGKATQEIWGEMRDSSWAGVQEMYEKGEISEDQLNTFFVIKNLSDEEWLQVKNDYLAGNISKEEFEQIKQIREMPEDLNTLENNIKGAFYGVSTGVCEGVQWYLGGKLANWAYKGSQEKAGTEHGGWQSTLTDVGIGFISSTGGEVFDGIKNDRNVAKQARQISNLVDILNTDNSSDPRVVNLIENSFKDWLSKNNPYAEKLINKLIELKQTYPGLTFKVAPDNVSSWSEYSKTLYLGDNQISWGDSGTYAHEIGHLLFNLVLLDQLPDNWDNIVAKAKILSSTSNNGQLHNTIANINNNENLNHIKAQSSFENSIKDAGYKSIDDFVDTWTKTIETDLDTTGLDNTVNSLRNVGFDEDVIQLLYDQNISVREIVLTYVNTKISLIKENFDRLQDGGTNAAVSGIICSVYEGTKYDLNGAYLNYTYDHQDSYYNLNKINSFHEIIANFTQLKMSGNTKALKELKSIFGDEFYLALEETFNKLIQ